MNSRFTTVSSSQKGIVIIAVTWLVSALVSFAALLVSSAFFIFLEALMAVCYAVMLVIVSRVKWVISFEGNVLTVTNTANKTSFRADSLSRDSFVFSQTKKQKAKNLCDLRIEDSPFQFCGVKNFNELAKYVYLNFN